VFRFLLWAILAALKPKALLVAENLCLRQQLLVLQRRQRRVGRGVTTPTPHRTGRAELPLTGSSRESFAHGGVMSNAVRDSLVNCQFSYPLTFRVRGCEAQSPLPCPVSGPLLATPPFP